MKGKRSIGVILSDEAGQGLTQDFFAAVLESFRRHCDTEGYHAIFLNNIREGEGAQTYLEQVREHGCGGVLIACAPHSDEIEELLKSDIVVAAVDADYQNAIRIKSDNCSGIEHLTQYLIEMGHRKMGLVMGDENLVSRIRLNGFLNVCRENGIEVPDEYIRQGKFRDMKKAAYHTEKLVKLPNPPTCILYSDDYAAIGGINTLHARGYEIPDDISVTGYDGNDILLQYEPRLTTVRQNTARIGELAAKQLFYHMQNPDADRDCEYIIETTLEKGRSVARVHDYAGL